jgi:hypothetical protein
MLSKKWKVSSHVVFSIYTYIVACLYIYQIVLQKEQVCAASYFKVCVAVIEHFIAHDTLQKAYDSE